MAEPRLSRVVVSAQVYQWCLRAYPAAFRQAYGREMAQVFRDSCRESYARAGGWGILRLWLRVLGDLIVTALGERLAALRYRHTGGLMPARERLGRPVWLEWACAGAVTWGAAPLLSGLVNTIRLQIMGMMGSQGWAGGGTDIVRVAVQGIILAFAQWLVARRYLRHADRWLWVTMGAVGLIVGGMLVGTQGPMSAQLHTHERIVLLEGVVLGVAQWLVLRTRIARAGWWIGASALGWFIGMIADVLVVGSVVRMAGPVGIANTWWFGIVAMLGTVLGGGLYGAVLGRVFVSFMRRSSHVLVS